MRTSIIGPAKRTTTSCASMSPPKRAPSKCHALPTTAHVPHRPPEHGPSRASAEDAGRRGTRPSTDILRIVSSQKLPHPTFNMWQPRARYLSKSRRSASATALPRLAASASAAACNAAAAPPSAAEKPPPPSSSCRRAERSCGAVSTVSCRPPRHTPSCRSCTCFGWHPTGRLCAADSR